MALVKIDVSEEPNASFIRVTRSRPILVTLIKEAPGTSQTSVLTRATWHNNPEDTILHSPFTTTSTDKYILQRDTGYDIIIFVCLSPLASVVFRRYNRSTMPLQATPSMYNFLLSIM
jgi:hypothetical protein